MAIVTSIYLLKYDHTETPSDELASHLADIKLLATEREYELLQALKSQGKEINRLRAAASPAVLAEVDEGDPVRTPSVRYEFSVQLQSPSAVIQMMMTARTILLYKNG